MRTEDERNWTVVRKILALCDQGANDEVSDGSDGSEPWTEQDRHGSRSAAEWLRATLFTPPNTAPRHATGEQIFTDDQLWIELENDDVDRQDAAGTAIDALASLASLRAVKRGTSFIAERHHIFDVGLIEADVRGGDDELREAALQVLDDVFHMRGLIEAAEGASTPEETEWAKQLTAKVQAKLAEMERALEEQRNGGGS